MQNRNTTATDPSNIEKQLARAIPGLDINSVIERDPRLEHNAREELGSITRGIADFIGKYHPEGTSSK